MSDGKTLWHGRFASGPAVELMAYTASLPFDRRLWREDIACSKSHVRGLAEVDIISNGERDAILAALAQVENEMATD
ncbi:MAG: argininosuccinate lyase, partial [Actinomycetota bacterium]